MTLLSTNLYLSRKCLGLHYTLFLPLFAYSPIDYKELTPSNFPHFSRFVGPVVKVGLGTAYNRTKFLDDRRDMMNAWANYLDGLKTANLAKAVPFERAAG